MCSITALVSNVHFNFYPLAQIPVRSVWSSYSPDWPSDV